MNNVPSAHEINNVLSAHEINNVLSAHEPNNVLSAHEPNNLLAAHEINNVPSAHKRPDFSPSPLSYHVVLCPPDRSSRCFITRVRNVIQGPQIDLN